MKATAEKSAKTRITVVVAANATGTQKKKLLVIGKSKRPHVFRGQNVPVPYCGQTNAWMDGKFFMDTLKLYLFR